MNNSTLLLGPYIGSFKDEVQIFIPHTRWVAENVIQTEKIVVCTHGATSFMYSDWAETVSVDPFLSGYDQHAGIINRNVDKRNYSKYFQTVKNTVSELYNINKNQLKTYSINYSQTLPYYSLYQKTFRKIPLPTDILESIDRDTILFIPDPSETLERLEEIFTLLNNEYNVLVIGDHTTVMDSENVLLHDRFIKNNYKYIIQWISECKMVVCPTGFWTSLCKLQGKEVFSWGDGALGQYKDGNHSCIMSVDKSTPIEKIFKQIQWYEKKI